jgi:hypothetical protein
MVHALSKLYIGVFCVFDDVIGLFLSCLHGRLLDNDGLSKVLEELVELDERVLNLLNVIVTSTDSAEDGCCSTRAVRFELLTKLAFVLICKVKLL